MNLSGDVPAPIKQVKFIIHRKGKQFRFGNEAFLTQATNGCEVHFCAVLCSHLFVSEQISAGPPPGLCDTQIRNTSTRAPTPAVSDPAPPPLLVLKCRTWMMLHRLIEQADRLGDKRGSTVLWFRFFWVWEVTFQRCFLVIFSVFAKKQIKNRLL